MESRKGSNTKEGKLAQTKIRIQQTSNNVAFRVSRNAAVNTGNAAFATIAFDTEQYDLGGNVSSGVFTAPITGYYHFNWMLVFVNSATAGIGITSLFYGGVEYSRGITRNLVGAEMFYSGGSDIIYMELGKTADIRAYAAATSALSVGQTKFNYFSGYLVSPA